MRTDDELESVLGAVAGTRSQDVVNFAASRDARAIERLPPSHSAKLRLQKALRKDMVKHVLKIMQPSRSMLELDKLSRSGLRGAGRLVVDDPELVRVRHCRSGEVRERGRRQERRRRVGDGEVAGKAGKSAAGAGGRYGGRLKNAKPGALAL